MKVEFDVESEKTHHVQFSFGKVWRGLSIQLDGKPVVHEARLFSARGWDVESYSFDVGTAPVRHVVLEKWSRSGPFSTTSSGPKVLAPGLRPQPLRAFVDGQLAAVSAQQPVEAPAGPLTA